MKKIFKLILIILVIVAGIYFYMTTIGHDLESILNTPKKIELKAECTDLENLLIVSIANLTVKNLYNRTHKDVTSKVTAYDKNGNIIKQRTIVFNETLQSNSSLTKIIRLPAKTKRCDCIIIDSNPE